MIENSQTKYLQQTILFEQEQIKRFLMRLVADLLFRGDKNLIITEDLVGVSTFRSKTIMRNYSCAPEFCIQVLEVFFPQILLIEKIYPPKWMRWIKRPHFQVTFLKNPNALVNELQPLPEHVVPEGDVSLVVLHKS